MATNRCGSKELIHSIYPGDRVKYWVDFNWYWAEVAKKKPQIQAKLIYLGNEPLPVGFIAYGLHYSDRYLKEEVPGFFEIYHIVIDALFQSKGIGKAATLLAVEEIGKLDSSCKIKVACHPDNMNAMKLYQSFGFKRCGRNYDNDPLFELKEIDICSVSAVYLAPEGNFNRKKKHFLV